MLIFISKAVSLFEQESTPMSGHSLQDWRGRLRSQLDTHASYQRESLIRAVAQICHDLETRCNTIEAPLRCERERASALEAELSQTRECILSLEQRRTDDDLYLQTLRNEKTQLENDKKNIEARIENLQIQFERSRSQSELTLREQEEIFASNENELKSTIDHLTKTLETLENELKASRDELAAQNAQNDELQIQFAKEQAVTEKERQMSVQLGDLCEGLKIRLEKEEHELSESRESIIHKEAELTQLTNASRNLETELQQSRSELKTATGELQDLQARHHELAQNSTRALHEVEAQYELEIERVTAKSADELNHINVSTSTHTIKMSA